MQAIAAPLLAWYHQNRRKLPFREEPSPYRVWVSEIMLQQTRVSAVLPYYERFMARLPNPAALAACSEDELHKLWQGLGYYNRARNMQKAAKVLVAQYGGSLPKSFEALLALPGIGPYTAGAIASIAFGLPEVAVDGNVLRVFSRLLASSADISLPETKKKLSALVSAQQPKETPGDFNQALMELGALVCTPGVPHCPLCPLEGVCEGNRRGLAAQLPVIAPKAPKLTVPVCVLVLHSPEGRVLLHRRGKTGLLAGLYEPLVLEGQYTKTGAEEALASLPGKVKLGAALPTAKHVFTHRIWQMYGWQGHFTPAKGAALPEDFLLASLQQLQEAYALPGAFKAYLPLMATGRRT